MAIALGFGVEVGHRKFSAFLALGVAPRQTRIMHYFSSALRHHPRASTGSTRSMPSGLYEGMLKLDAQRRHLFGGRS